MARRGDRDSLPEISASRDCRGRGAPWQRRSDRVWRVACLSAGGLHRRRHPADCRHHLARERCRGEMTPRRQRFLTATAPDDYGVFRRAPRGAPEVLARPRRTYSHRVRNNGESLRASLVGRSWALPRRTAVGRQGHEMAIGERARRRRVCDSPRPRAGTREHGASNGLQPFLAALVTRRWHPVSHGSLAPTDCHHPRFIPQSLGLLPSPLLQLLRRYGNRACSWLVADSKYGQGQDCGQNNERADTPPETDWLPAFRGH